MRKLTEKKPRRTLQTCYVCQHKITGDPVALGLLKGQTEEDRLYRHIRCEPGSARWMESKRSLESDVTEYFGVEGCGGEKVRT